MVVAVALWIRCPLGATCTSTAPQVLSNKTAGGGVDDGVARSGFSADYGIVLTTRSCRRAPADDAQPPPLAVPPPAPPGGRGANASSPLDDGLTAATADQPPPPPITLGDLQLIGALAAFSSLPLVPCWLKSARTTFRSPPPPAERPSSSPPAALSAPAPAAGTHNSYHQAPLLAFSPAFRYSHPPLEAQLASGLRHLELDVHWSPIKGWTVWHQPFVDPRSSCRCLRSCLLAVREWSAKNPRHLMLVVYLEPKFLYDSPLGNPCAGGRPEGLVDLQRTIASGAAARRRRPAGCSRPERALFLSAASAPLLAPSCAAPPC